MTHGWRTRRSRRRGDLHVEPVADLRPHARTRRCWCHPQVQRVDGVRTRVVVHHSLDGRELIERHGVN